MDGNWLVVIRTLVLFCNFIRDQGTYMERDFRSSWQYCHGVLIVFDACMNLEFTFKIPSERGFQHHFIAIYSLLAWHKSRSKFLLASHFRCPKFKHTIQISLAACNVLV